MKFKVSYQILTFDAYSALFDVHGSLEPAVRSVFGERVNASRFAREWRSNQLEYAQLSNSLGQGHLSFWGITSSALNYTAALHRLKLSIDQHSELMETWNYLRPWPEAEYVLSELRMLGFELAILSNGDKGMLSRLASHFNPLFSYIFSAEAAGVYKPAPGVYGLVETVGGVTKSSVMHIAGSCNDVLGARTAGLDCIWSNRDQRPLIDPRYPPNYEVKDLRGIIPALNCCV